MSFAQKYNRVISRFKFKTYGLPYKKLADLYEEYGTEKVFSIGSVFINTKNRFGDQPVIAAREGFCVSLPLYLRDDCLNMIEDDDTVSDINSGLCGFSVMQYESHGRTCFSVMWEDIDPDNPSPSSSVDIRPLIKPVA